ncbi:DNA polymerase III subunit gamma and tau, partial [Streptomyces mesophilus]
PQTPPPAAPAPQAAGASSLGAPPPGSMDVRSMWPNILEAVKNRRRFTWILLSQNAQVAGFDGQTLQLGFLNAGARDNFTSSGSEDVLKQALAEQFNANWKIEAIIDPSGGSSPPPAATGFGGSGGTYSGGAPAAQRPQAPAPQQSAPPAAAAPAPQQPTPAPAPSSYNQGSYNQDANSQGRQGGPSQNNQNSQNNRGSYDQEPPPVSIEDDIPEEDDPDLDESALSGHDLIVRELGATVIEEIANE